MWVFANCLDLKLCSILCLFFLFGFRFRQFSCQEWVSWHDKESMKLLVYTGFDIVKSTYRLIESVESIRQKHLNKPSFEVGYVMFTVFEKYRKMVDKYNTSIFMGKQLFTMELIMYLEQIENHHWEIEHLTIQRPWAVQSSAALHKVLNDSIYKELSWSAKLLLLKDLMKTHNKTEATMKGMTLTTPLSFAAAKQAGNYPKRVIGRRFSRSVTQKNSMIKAKDAGLKTGRRIPSIEALVAGPKDGRRMPGYDALEDSREQAQSMPRREDLAVQRRQEETTKQVTSDDDNSMRLKLFRLMYETIKDSDMKCKRAELIRAHYENSSSFEIGYLMGDIMDKYNIMSDISMTLNRLFHEWKPIEHINAFEQISNQAIEINHLIDMMKGISRRRIKIKI